MRFLVADLLFWLWPICSVLATAAYAVWQRRQMELIKDKLADCERKAAANEYWCGAVDRRASDLADVAKVAAERIAALQSAEPTGHVSRAELHNEISHIAQAILSLNKRTIDIGKSADEANAAAMKYVGDAVNNLSEDISGVDDKVEAALKAAHTESSLFRAAVAAIETETTRISNVVIGASKNAKVAVDLLESMNVELRETSARATTLRTDLDRFTSDSTTAYQALESDLGEIVAAVQSYGDRLDGTDVSIGTLFSRADEALSNSARVATRMSDLTSRVDGIDETIDELDDCLTKLEDQTVPDVAEQVGALRQRQNDLLNATMTDYASISKRVDQLSTHPSGSDLRELILSSNQQQAAETNRIAMELGKAIDQMAARLAKLSKARTRFVQRPAPRQIEAAAQ